MNKPAKELIADMADQEAAIRRTGVGLRAATHRAVAAINDFNVAVQRGFVKDADRRDDRYAEVQRGKLEALERRRDEHARRAPVPS